MVIFLITRVKVISRNEKLILSDDIKQFELLEKIINNEFGSIEEYNILLDNSFYYNFITNKEYSNEVKDKIKILERINMGVEKNYTLSLEYYNNCLISYLLDCLDSFYSLHKNPKEYLSYPSFQIHQASFSSL